MGSFDGLLQAGQGVGPELVEQGAQWLERFGAQRVEPAGALPALGQQAGPLKDGEVLADRLLGEVEVGGDLPGGAPRAGPAAGSGGGEDRRAPAGPRRSCGRCRLLGSGVIGAPSGARPPSSGLFSGRRARRARRRTARGRPAGSACRRPGRRSRRGWRGGASAGVAHLEALEAGVEAVVVEAQLGAGADRSRSKVIEVPTQSGPGSQTSTLQRTREGRSASSTRITTSWSPMRKRSFAGAGAAPSGVHQPVRASMSVSAENTVSGAAAKVLVERKSSVSVASITVCSFSRFTLYKRDLYTRSPADACQGKRSSSGLCSATRDATPAVSRGMLLWPMQLQRCRLPHRQPPRSPGPTVISFQ